MLSMISSVTLSHEALQNMKVDAIGYGAKDTGEMGGGAGRTPVFIELMQVGVSHKSGSSRGSLCHSTHL